MPSDVLLFPPFRLDVQNQELWNGSRSVALRPKTFAVLVYLARHAQRLVTKEELLRNVWASVSVDSELLRGYVAELRLALADDARAPRYLATISRRGYKFLPRVTFESDVAPGSRQEPAESPASERAPASRRSRAPITVGVLHSLTGMTGDSETPVVDATLLAIEEINQRGGVGGHPVRAVVVDGESDERVFAASAERLIREQEIQTLFGCWTSASRRAVRDVVESHDRLLIYPMQFEGMEQSPNIVYTGAAPNQQILPAIRWAFGFLRHRRFFLAGYNSVFSWAVHALMRDEIVALGGEVVGDEYITGDDADNARTVRRIQQTRPDLILNSIGGRPGQGYSRALRAAGVTPQVVPTIYFSLGEIELRKLPRGQSAGDYAAWNYFQSLERPENQTFINRFRSRYGSHRVLADPMEAAYFGVNMWAQAVETAGSERASAVRQAMRVQSFHAPEGHVHIDPENQYTWKTMRIGRIADRGQFDVLWSSERPMRPEPFASSRLPGSWSDFLDDLHRRWDGRWSGSVAV
jgi:urea transport system substrate-binding protein